MPSQGHDTVTSITKLAICRLNYINYCELLIFFEETYIHLSTRERCSGRHASLALSLYTRTALQNSENKYPTEPIVKKHKCLTGALPRRAEHCVCAIGNTMELTSCLTLRGHDHSVAALITQNIASE